MIDEIADAIWTIFVIAAAALCWVATLKDDPIHVVMIGIALTLTAFAALSVAYWIKDHRKRT